MRTELEEKIDKIRNGAKKRIKELEETIVKNKSESDQTIKDLQNKIERVCKLTDLSRQEQKLTRMTRIQGCWMMRNISLRKSTKLSTHLLSF